MSIITTILMGIIAVLVIVAGVFLVFSKKGQSKESVSWDHMTELKKHLPKEDIDRYIDKTYKYRAHIKEEKILAELSELTELLEKTRDFYERNPEVKSKVDRFLDSYMPTTLQFAGKFYDVPRSVHKIENEEKMIDEIAEGMDVINRGLEAFLNNLYDDVITNINVDTEVINSVLGSEGYFAADDIAKHFQREKEVDHYQE